MQVRPLHKFLVLGAAVLCLAAGITLVRHVRASLSSHTKHAAPGTAGEDPGQAPFAAVVPVKRDAISNSLSIAGQFIPYQNVELHAKVAGYIRKIYVDIGDHVHTGQVLAVLDVPELVAQVNEAQAAAHHAQEEIARAQSDVARAEADHVALHANAARLVNADKARPGLIAQQELDDATAKDRASEAQVEAAKSSLSAARQQLEVAKADQQHYSALNDYARITAPYDGVVTWRFSDTGALVQAGTSNTSGLPVVTVAQISTLRLRIPVPESLAAKVRLGDPVDVHFQATGEHFTGKVARFTDSLDTSTRTMQVEIDVPNPNYHLQPGMYADVVLAAGRQANVLTVPINAIQRNQNTTTVLLVDAQDRVQRRMVQVGAEDSNKVEILSGLSEGDRIIIGNLGSYREGELVRPRESAPMTVGTEAE
jgi:RND family efflux transporter MFP subunit